MKSLVETKSLFFDREAIRKAFSRAELKVLSKFGAFVRRTARQSIRKASGKRVANLSAKLRQEKSPQKRQRIQAQIETAKAATTSKPGQPPKGHGQQLLKQGIQFAADPASRSVVIGAVKLNKPGMTPETLEYGGPTAIRGKGKSRRVRVKPRPYMAPAFTKNQPKLSQLWADSVK